MAPRRYFSSGAEKKRSKNLLQFFDRLSLVAGNTTNSACGRGIGLPDGYSSKLWITTPERSLGSNQVVFGGMMLPVSAMLMSCCIETG